MRCKKCDSKKIVKAGFKKTKTGRYQKYKCKECNYFFTKNLKFIRVTKQITTEDIKFFQKQKCSLREIARIKQVSLSTIQYHLNKD